MSAVQEITRQAYKRKAGTVSVLRKSENNAIQSLSDENKAFWTQSEAHKRLFAEISDELFDLSQLDYGFCAEVRKYIKMRGYNKVTFCEKTLLSEKYYQRIMDDAINQPTREAVMSICIGLDIWGYLGEELFKIAGFSINARMIVYIKILHLFRGHDIYECDEVLRMFGLPSIIKQ